MQNTIISPENFKIGIWSGGTTTQLFIYPQTADYTQRNFAFRLSTAKVNTDKSDFTPLCGISRKIMVLDGEMTIKHENQYSKILHKFDVDEFDGAWKTSSLGKCTDFNLMTSGNTTGELSASILEKNQMSDYQIEDKWSWIFIYLFSGNIIINLDDGLSLNQGSLLALRRPANKNLFIKGIEKSELVFIRILL